MEIKKRQFPTHDFWIFINLSCRRWPISDWYKVCYYSSKRIYSFCWNKKRIYFVQEQTDNYTTHPTLGDVKREQSVTRMLRSKHQHKLKTVSTEGKSADAQVCVHVLYVCVCTSVFKVNPVIHGGFCHCHSGPFHISPAYASGTFYFICLPSTKVWMIDGPTSASLCPFIKWPVLG